MTKLAILSQHALWQHCPSFVSLFLPKGLQ